MTLFHNQLWKPDGVPWFLEVTLKSDFNKVPWIFFPFVYTIKPSKSQQLLEKFYLSVIFSQFIIFSVIKRRHRHLKSWSAVIFSCHSCHVTERSASDSTSLVMKKWKKKPSNLTKRFGWWWAQSAVMAVYQPKLIFPSADFSAWRCVVQQSVSSSWNAASISETRQRHSYLTPEAA